MRKSIFNTPLSFTADTSCEIDWQTGFRDRGCTCKDCIGSDTGFLDFLGIGCTKNKKEKYASDALNKYPFPPKDCAEAYATIEKIRVDLQRENTRLSTGDGVGCGTAPAAQAYAQSLDRMNNWILQNCGAGTSPIPSSDPGTQTPPIVPEPSIPGGTNADPLLSSAVLPNVNTNGGTAKGVPSWVWYAGGGLVVLIGAILIFKK